VAAIRNAMQGKVLSGDVLRRWDVRQPKREDNSTERTRRYRERHRPAGRQLGTTEASPATGDEAGRHVTGANVPERSVTRRDDRERNVTRGDSRGEERRVEEKDPVFPLRENTDAPRVSAVAEPAVAASVEPTPPETPQPPPSRPIGDVLWTEGLAYLKRAGVADKHARSLLGRWRRDFGDGEALAAIAEADKAAATQPVEFITAILQRRRTTRSRDAPASTRYAI
jgi:hypothetical protein